MSNRNAPIAVQAIAVAPRTTHSNYPECCAVRMDGRPKYPLGFLGLQEIAWMV